MAPKNNDTSTFEATVIKGRGLATKRIEILQSHLNIADYKIYPGSLNSVLKRPILFEKQSAVLNVENNWYFWNIKVNGVDCLAYRYPMCPFHILEIVSKHKLRTHLGLKEGDPIQIEIGNEILATLTWVQVLLWNIAWKGRESLYYSSNLYAKLIGKFLNLRHRMNANK